MPGKPKAGERMKVGRRLLVVPGVRSMTNPNPVVSTTKSGADAPEKPTEERGEELSEELIRTIKAAYQ